MKLNQVGSNRTILTLNNGTRIGFSYETPVVAEVDGVTYKTEKKFSVTTSKHCGQLLSEMGSYGAPELKPQEFFEALLP
jgi:hypothetical protein